MKKIAIVVSKFNEDITQALLDGALERLTELQFDDEHVRICRVPGAIEIPLIAKQFALKGEYAAIITLGAVIRGETSHYDYVCDQVARGCMKVSLKFNIPVIFGVLTTENVEQAQDRVGGAHGHKGRDAVDCAFEMIELMDQLN